MRTFTRKGEWLEVQLSKKEEGFLASILEQMFHLSTRQMSKWMHHKKIVLNGSLVSDLNQVVQAGDRLMVHLFEEEEYGVDPEPIPIDVLYEDDHILVVNKQAGISVHPTEPGQRGTLAHAIAHHYQLQGLQIKVRHIHRIDKDTSGAILIAKHALAHTILDQDLRKHHIHRQYVAFAVGQFAQKSGTIDKPIGRDRHHPTRRRVSATGDPAITHYDVLEQYQDGAYVRLKLETGRTHQIRVHLSAIGHPLYGDTLYGGPRYPIRRQALHGERLHIVHPITREEMEFYAPMPEDMVQLLKYLQGHAN